MSAEKSCERCLWFLRDERWPKGDDYEVTKPGHCHRRSPGLTNSSCPEDGWPFVFGTDFCGDFQNAETQQQ